MINARRWFVSCLCGLPLLWVIGCASKGDAKDGIEGRDGQDGAQSSGIDTRGLGERGGDALGDAGGPLSQRVFYFDYDVATVREEDQPTIAAHARYLSEHPSTQVRMEGHADERGTREYNIALAESRALAVQRLLLVGGAAAGQMSLLSYGEERPAALGHDEGSWRLNRRVEIVYP
jgi:peptidoglycan-associated lipoprotein